MDQGALGNGAVSGTPLRVHCSYHKCLTVYFSRVFTGLLNRTLPWRGRFQHYNSDIEAFGRSWTEARVASVNNRALDLNALEAHGGGRPLRVTRFLRDPRDLVVSGYFYHRRGAEAWTRMVDPKPSDWAFANGVIPRVLKENGGSFSQCLQKLDTEQGLLAELEFRRRHFESMAQWPQEDARVLQIQYEDVLKDPVHCFDRIFQWYGLSDVERRSGRWWAQRHALKPQAQRHGKAMANRDTHIRNPSPGQWREHFSGRLQSAFEAQHPGLLDRLGYAEA